MTGFQGRAAFRVEGEYRFHGDRDDGHHPTEIAAVMSAARPMTRARLIVAFQPHRFTRTQMLMADFGPALSGADIVLLTDVYGAGEEPIPGVDVDVLADAVRKSFAGDVRVVRSLAAVAAELGSVAQPEDLIVLLGAGSIGSIAPDVLQALRRTD